MGSFFKKIGKGLLYLVVLPIYLVSLAISAIISFGGFIVLFFKSVILFFTGRSLYEDLPEDKLAKQALEAMKPKVPEYTEPEEVKAEIVTPIVDAEVSSTSEQIESNEVNEISIQPESNENYQEIPADPEQNKQNIENNNIEEFSSQAESESKMSSIDNESSLPNDGPEIIEEYKSESHIFSDVEEEGGKDD